MRDYLTVSQFAELTGKDPGNIRRLLINGKLQGEKVGSQWLIPRNAEYPADRRVKSGEYRNWRQRYNKKKPDLLQELTSLCAKFREIFGDSMEQVILHGAYARGEESEGASVELAIMFTSNQTEELFEKMMVVIADCQNRLGIALSVAPIVLEDYLKWKDVLPSYKNIMTEGIVLWKHED